MARNLEEKRIALFETVYPDGRAGGPSFGLDVETSESPLSAIERCYAELKARSLPPSTPAAVAATPQVSTMMTEMDPRFFAGLPDQVVLLGRPAPPPDDKEAISAKVYPSWYSTNVSPPTEPWTSNPNAPPSKLVQGSSGQAYPPCYRTENQPAITKQPSPALQNSEPTPPTEPSNQPNHSGSNPGLTSDANIPDKGLRSLNKDGSCQELIATTRKNHCGFCGGPRDAKDTGELLGPFVTKKGRLNLYVHAQCALWTPECFLDETQTMRNVYDAHTRGKSLSCSHCRRKGATIGCYNDRCRKVYHYLCMREAKCTTVQSFYYSFCPSHAKLATEPIYLRIMEADAFGHLHRAANVHDTTWGLDCPHSRYTALRRNETETIFSRVWLASSMKSLDSNESALGIFSHRSGNLLTRYDRFQYRAKLRAVRRSNYSLISGDFYKKAPTAKPSSKAFLFRCFRRAPEVRASDYTVVEPVMSSGSRDILKSNIRSGVDHSISKTQDVKLLQSPCQSKKTTSDGVKSSGSPQVSGWQKFLSEQLPNELNARPRGGKGAAMMNLARKWSAMRTSRKKHYENLPISPNPSPSLADSRPLISGAAPENLTGSIPSKRPKLDGSDRGLNCGLFKVSESMQNNVQARGVAISGPEDMTQARQMTRERTRTSEAQVNLDDIFPAILDEDEGLAEKVREPPTIL